MTAPHTVAEANVALALDTSRMDMEFRRAMASLSNTLATAGVAGGHAYGRALQGSMLPHLRTIERLIGTALGVEAFRRLSLEIMRVGAMFDQLAVRMRYLSGTETVVKDIVEGAQKMGMSIESAAQAFSRIAVPAKELGLTRQEVITLHQALAALGRIGGTTAGELRNALYQITQAMASGRLGGDELRSMMENMALATQLLARELGVGVGQLRILGEQGAITGDILAKAILGNAQQILDMFERMPPTLDMVHARVRNSMEVLFNEIDKRWKLSQLYKDIVQGYLIKAIDAISDAIRRSGVPTQRQEEMAAVGIVRDPKRVARTEAERVLHAIATGQLLPLQEQKELQEEARRKFRENVDRLVETMSGWIRDALGEVHAHVTLVPRATLERMSADEDRAAALRLGGIAGARMFTGLAGIRARLDRLREYEMLSPEDLQEVMDRFARHIEVLPNPAELEAGLSVVRARLTKYGELLRDFDHWIHQPIADVVAMVAERLKLEPILKQEGIAVLRERFQARLSRAGVRAQDPKFVEIVSDVLREMLAPYHASIFAGMEGDELAKYKEWNAALDDVGRVLRDRILNDLTAARLAIVESITEAVRDALKRYVEEQAEQIADIGIASYVAGQERVSEAITFAREPGRKMAVLEAHRGLGGDLSNLLNAVDVTIAQVRAAIEKIQERTRDPAERLKKSIKEEEQIEIGRLEARRGQILRAQMPEHLRQRALEQLGEQETRLRRTVAEQLVAIDDEQMQRIRERIATIREGERAAVLRLLPAQAQIASIEATREKKLQELSDELNRARQLYAEQADQAQRLAELEREIAAARADVEAGASIRIEDVRGDALRRALTLFEQQERSATDAARRWTDLQWQESHIQRSRDEAVARMWAEFESAAAVVSPQEYSRLFERYARSVQATIEGAEMQIEGLRADELDDVTRTLQNIRELGESYENSASRTLNLERQLAEIEDDRVNAHRRLADYQAELTKRIQALPEALRAQAPSVQDVNELVTQMATKIDSAAEALKTHRIESAQEEVARILSRMANLGENIHATTRRTRSEVAEIAELERLRARWMAEQAEYATAFEQRRSAATPEQVAEFQSRTKQLDEEMPRAIAMLRDFLTGSAAQRVRQDILNTYVGIANAMGKQVPIALEIQNIEMRTAATLAWIQATRTELANSEQESLRALIPLLETLEEDVRASEQAQINRLYDMRGEQVDEIIERMTDLGDSALRAHGKIMDGEQKIVLLLREHSRELRQLDALYRSIEPHVNELSFLRKTEAEETRDATAEKLDEALVLGVERERAKIERELLDELDRVRNEVWSRRARYGDVAERKRAIDEATQRRLEQLKDFESQFGVFTPHPSVPGDLDKAEALAARQQRAREQLSDLRRLVELTGELRKAEIDESASERSQSKMRSNIEVITDLERALNTVYDEREDFIGRWLDRLNDVATAAQRAVVREKAGLLFDREEERRERERIRDALRDLQESETPRRHIQTRQKELALALETGRITREQHDLELAINELRLRRLPMDAAEVQEYLQAVRAASAHMASLELEQERLAFARSWTSAITEGLQSIASEAENATDAVRELVRELSMLTIRYAIIDPAAKYLAGALSSGFAAIGKAFGFASGGIMSSAGPVPIPAGRLARPMIGVFGEGAMAEAAVPLPDGRNIPVDLRVDGAPAARVTNISIDARASVDPAMVAANAHRAAAQLLAEMQRRGRMG